MDRREALKKLAVGGAIAAGGSLVLSSNAVAQTSSGAPAGIIGAPGPGEDLAIDFDERPDGNNNGKRLTLGSVQPMSCGSPSGVLTVWYTWFIDAANLDGGGNGKKPPPVLELRSASNPFGLPLASGVGDNTGAPNTTLKTVSISRSDGSGMKKDSFTISVEIEAECSDAGGRYLITRYQFQVRGIDSVTQTQTDWRELNR
jgi:hypothetical protein